MNTPGDREDQPGSGHVRVRQSTDSRTPLSVEKSYGYTEYAGEHMPDPLGSEPMTHRERIMREFTEGQDLSEGVNGRTAFDYTVPEARVAGVPGCGPQGSPEQYERLLDDD